jgi:hypothetical protein
MKNSMERVPEKGQGVVQKMVQVKFVLTEKEKMVEASIKEIDQAGRQAGGSPGGQAKLGPVGQAKLGPGGQARMDTGEEAAGGP